MDRRTRRLFLLAVGGVLLLATLGGGGTDGPPDAPSVDGVVIGVDSAGIGNVSAFTLRTLDGQRLVFGLARLGNVLAFPPDHLAEHLATAQQIRVWYRTSDAGGLEALWLEDLPAG